MTTPELKERILVQAEVLFCHYGIKRITMDDLAKDLGISKRTIYVHFRDKDELVHLLITEMLGRETSVMAKNELETNNAVEEIFHVVAQLSGLISRMNPIIFYDLQKFHPQTWQLFQNHRYDNMRGCLIKNFKRGIREGLYRGNINMEILSIMRMDQVDAIFNHIVYPIGNFDLSEVMTEITEHFLYGLCTLKGHVLINEYKQIIEE
ncbi:TetR/AcrR family transcriptional regulator [Arcticibacter eurypsychrophilus]|uniref:TetR/AcrR family transcriptional regulator n=1 Tax=Arcticibacter eurypsychrophilus TaxID=1434752 RepID=UPI00084E030C|nr:TetR/AcrR family transcriptional regulator [Arcticibacter eurypsychrophilus]